MKKKTKKSLIEYGVIIAIFGGLYITELHTEVLGFLQRGILATGLINPDLEKDLSWLIIKHFLKQTFL